MQRKILIIDDEPQICHMLAEFFDLKGYSVRSVSRGEEAMALSDAFEPDVILLDLLMPGMSGVDLLKEFKQQRHSPKVIMLSAADHEEVAQGAIKLGADSYVCKPANLRELERLVSGFWPSE